MPFGPEAAVCLLLTAHSQKSAERSANTSTCNGNQNIKKVRDVRHRP